MRENEIQSGVVCETDTDEIENFMTSKSFTLGWMEQTIGVRDDGFEITAADLEFGEDTEFLHHRFREAKDYISNLDETKILNFKFKKW